MSHIYIYITAIELIKELMDYELGAVLLSGLVSSLRPAKEDIIQKPDLLDGMSMSFFLFLPWSMYISFCWVLSHTNTVHVIW